MKKTFLKKYSTVIHDFTGHGVCSASKIMNNEIY